MNEKNIESKDCCKANEQKENRGILSAITYGLIPHIGCIAFIVFTVLGMTTATAFLKPFMLSPYFFYALITLSFTFTTLSAVIYLKRRGFMSLPGIRRKWKYLSTLYGTTISINLLLFLVVFPLLANVTLASSTSGITALSNNGNVISSLKLSVDIPCSGHASLITGELKTINGVTGVQFSLPNVFDVKYDSAKTTKQQILALEVFKTYKATVLGESTDQQTNSLNVGSGTKSNTIGESCCGGNGCGGSGSCGCGGR